jgi:hypothetical protein
MTANGPSSELPATENPHCISVNSWVAVFAGARDGYQVPIALKEAGLLKTLVTDFYGLWIGASFAMPFVFFRHLFSRN